ncbi:MAG: heterodisulfide reductase subunit [Clostridia bacterium]|jgi:heterodisulfide reductase subunit B|nr:heterodisulfide reductase subunit [Clostridia bacterium]MDN5323414.1 heterodisulfide reductase subunit [Clostridia bacterium]
MKYAYYPGCSLSSTGIEYDMSTKKVAKSLGIELWEIPEWNCCGASSAHLTDHLLALALPARNLAIAEAEGLDVAIPCAACYARCKATEVEVKNSQEMKKTISEVIEREYAGKTQARALLDVFVNDLGLDSISALVNKPLKDIKVASYYGCLLVRPPRLGFDDPEDPQSMDQLIKALGGTPVEWAFKTECCGAAHATTKSDVGFSMIEKILTAAKEAGADCIATACPLCMNNLDMRQSQVEAKFGKNYGLPVFYFTQLIGLALGLNPEELGVNKHFVNALGLVKKLLEAEGRRDTA